MSMMYHAQERIVNVPGAETTQTRGGIHKLCHPGRDEAYPYDWWLRTTILRL